MATVRMALANLPYPESREASVSAAQSAIQDAGDCGATVVCFPEGFVPGYRWPGEAQLTPDAGFLERAWAAIGEAAKEAGIAVILGTERLVQGRPMLTALVLGPDGARIGFQDKVQIDPSEDAIYVAGTGRRMFAAGGLRFGVVICHEGFRYPETVRWAARQGAQVVFHPHASRAEPGAFRPSEFGDPRNSFHEKTFLCRAAENTCYFAAVNYAGEGSPTTSALAGPDGTLRVWQPYGQPGLLVAEIETDEATGLLARRYRPEGFNSAPPSSSKP